MNWSDHSPFAKIPRDSVWHRIWRAKVEGRTSATWTGDLRAELRAVFERAGYTVTKGDDARVRAGAPRDWTISWSATIATP